MVGISSKSAGGVKNKKTRYNGYEFNSDFDINLYESFYRSHDPQIGRFWQLDPKPSEQESLYGAMKNNPILHNDPLGDTTIINLINKSNVNDAPVFKFAVDKAKENKNDGIFMTIGHGNPQLISNHKKDGQSEDKIYFTTPQAINNQLSNISSDYKTAMEEKKEITVMIVACNTASKKYRDENSPTKELVTTETPIAFAFSKKYPNITVIAADGYVVFEPSGKGIRGVANYKNDGGFLTIKNGVVISKKEMPTNYPK